MRASVVVPTYRRPETLNRCLSALVAQDFGVCDYEIIVADDAMSEETKRHVEEWSALEHPSVRYVPVTRARGPAAARNAGWRAAAGEIIAFTDDDCVPDLRWLSTGFAAFDPKTVAVAGRVIVPVPDTPTDYERDAAGLERGEFVTANCFCRRDALERIGGFDERFRAAWREDSDLQFALLERGGKIARVSNAIVFHPVRPAPWGVSVLQQRKSLFNALLYKKHRQLYRKRIQQGTPWGYYMAAGALLATLMSALYGNLLTCVLFASTWLVWTMQFCRRRLAKTAHTPAHVAEMMVTSALIPPLSVFWRLYGAWKFRVLFL
jgi:GT2 family glycosyltransferase